MCLFDGLVDLMAVLAGLLLIFTLFSVGASVVSRYFFSFTFGWVTEISAYSLLYITFLVAAWVLRREGHVKMDMVLSQLTVSTQSIVNVLTSAASAVVCLILSVIGWRVTWELFETGYFTPTTLELPKYVIVAIIPIGSSFLAIQFLRRVVSFAANFRSLEAGR